MNRTLLVMAAGTGGHVFPGLAIARELARRGWRIAWMGTPAGMEGRLVARAGYPMETVAMTGVRGKGPLAWLLLPLRLLVAFWQSSAILFRVRTDGGRVFDLYYDRAPAGPGDRKGSWYLFRELRETEA